MKSSAIRLGLLLVVITTLPIICGAANKSPCDIIAKAEAEALVGAKLEGPELSPRKTLCKYYEPGYGESPAKNKLVTIGLFYSDHPGREGVNMRRQAILQDQSIRPVTSRELPDFGDAAIWVWAGRYFGALYTFKGGTLEVAVKVSGISEPAALAAAKKFAARALGSTAKTGFVYAAPATMITARDYNAPGLLSPLYLGTFSQIPDDEMTRNYVLSLVQEFNGSCSKVPKIFAVLSYGAYYEWKANTDILKSGMNMNIDKQFQDMVEVLHRVHPHMLPEGHEDADQFLKLHSDAGECYTFPVEHLYNNIAELALERQNLPPDVDDDDRFREMLSPSARKNYEDGVPLPNHPSLAAQQQLKKIKQGCLEFGKGDVTGGMEAFCRCQVDALKEAHVVKNDLDALGAHFNQPTITELSKRYPVYDQRKKACYQ